MQDERTIVTRSWLVRDLRQLGLKAGDVVMLHASVKSVGWIVGGPDVVLQSIMDAVSPSGTLMMYVGWADGAYEMADWPEAKKQAYRDECPPFNPKTSRACMQWGILTEYLRTWPGACRSGNPEASCAAIGGQAEELTAHHPLDYGYGEDSPLARLYHKGGRILMIGAPLGTLTFLHYAEHVAQVPDKRVVRYSQPVEKDGEKVWVEVEEFDTNGIRNWDGDYFAEIARAYLTAGGGKTGRVGKAIAYLFDAPGLHRFAVAWLESHFGRDGGG